MRNIEQLRAEIDAPLDRPSWVLYGHCISPGDTVISLGPGMNPLRDFSTLTAAYLAGTKGKILIADPQPHFSMPSHELSGSHTTIRGAGAALEYIEYLKILNVLGLPLSDGEWLGSESGVEQLIVDDASANVVTDHNCVGYVIGMPDMKTITTRHHIVRRMVSESYRVLKDGGVCIIQADAYKSGFSNTVRLFDPTTPIINLREALRFAGFSTVLHTRVSDYFQIPLDDRTFEHMHRAAGSGMYISGFFADLLDHCIYDAHGTRFLFHTPGSLGYRTTHTSPDMWIAVK